MTGQPEKITDHNDWPLVRSVIWLFWISGLVAGGLVGLLVGWLWFR